MAAQVQLNGISGAITVTPSDSANLSVSIKGIYIGGAGNLAVTLTDGTQATFTAISPGMIHWISAKRILATGTTATNILAVY